ncbi:MAG TPA: L-threonylcarbamoyladenylate synthase [Pyrinomonadaceae bacterium]|nr:L-threonylcarbamoyladenylate synthase [Pyrinomonadaceae bacterium]
MILPDNQANRERAARTIAAGGLIAFRTDTFYGLGADPLNPPAIRQIIDLKGREGKPILLLISDSAEADRFIADQNAQFKLLAEFVWPGPLTIVSAANPGLSNDLTAGTGTIGVRLPDDASLRDLIRLCGGALTATSANRTGAAPARKAEEVAGYFQAGLDLILDSGGTTATAASTVVDVSKSVPRIIREGAISRTRLGEILGQIE